MNLVGRSPRRALWIPALVAFLLPVAAAAQDRDQAFASLLTKVTPGDQLIVTATDGTRLSGRVVDVERGVLTLSVRDISGERRFQVEPERVQRVARTDALWNGALIGLGAGIAAAEIWTYQVCGPPGYDDECAIRARAVGWLTMPGGGAALGALIDKLIGNQELYRASPSTALRVSPVVGRRAAGVVLSLAF